MSPFGWYAFLASIVFWPGIPALATVPRWAVIAVGLPLVSRLDLSEVEPSYLHMLFAGLVWASVGLAWTPDPLAGCLQLFYLLTLCLVFVAVAAADFDDIMCGLLAGVGVSAIVVLTQLAGHSPVAQFAPPAGLFFNRDILAEFAAPVTVWAVLTLRRRWLSAALIALLAILHSRSAALAAALGFVYASRLSLTGKLYLLSGIIVASIAAFIFGDAISAHQRIEIWRTTLTHLNLFGHGLGWFQVTFPLYQTSHSDLLQLIAELGIGSLAWLLIPIRMFAEARGSVVQRAVLLTCCVEAAVSFPLHEPMGGFVFAVAAGSLAGHRRHLLMGSTFVTG